MTHRQLVTYLLPLLLLAGGIQGAACGALTYVFTGTGSGSLGQQTFTERQFTITAVGDETIVTNPSFNVFRLDGTAAMLEIDGLGSANFTFSPTIFINRNAVPEPTVGISDPGQGLAIFSVGSNQLTNYELRTTFPLTSGRAINSLTAFFPTSQGAFNIDSASSASFTAVPEPTSFFMLAISLTACCSIRRRRLS